MRKRWKTFDESWDLGIEGLPAETEYFGYSAYIGPDGIPHVKTFGNVGDPKPRRPRRLEAPEPEGTRDPYTEVVMDEKNREAIVTLEMPGVDRGDIKIKATEGEIEINANTKDWNYYKNVQIETGIDPEKTSARYNNGVLEIRATLKDLGNPTGHNIVVE